MLLRDGPGNGRFDERRVQIWFAWSTYSEDPRGSRVVAAGAEGERAHNAGEGGRGLFQLGKEPLKHAEASLEKNLNFESVLNYAIKVFKRYRTSM